MRVKLIAKDVSLKPSDNCLHVVTEDCVVEFHAAKSCPRMAYQFLPLGATVTLVCHGVDKFSHGGQAIVIHERKIHTIVSLGDRYETDFTPEPTEEPAD